MNHLLADNQPWTIAQLSDIHLQRPQADQQQSRQDKRDRFHDILSLALSHKPDRIVLSGDLTEDGFDDVDELAWARDVLESLDAPPMLLIPGNHDVGNKPGADANAINAQRLANWNSVFGSDHFVEDLSRWRLIGLNSLLVDSNLPEETQQLLWLDQMLEQAQRVGQQVAVFMHEPPFIHQPGEVFGDRSDYWAIAPAKQPLYLQRLSHPTVKLVASGHVHWHRIIQRGDAVHCWCPSPAFIVNDPQFPRGGGVTGLMLYTLGPAGAQARLIPYHHDQTQVIDFHGA